MKIVVSEGYGGFHVSEDFCKYYNIPYETDEIVWRSCMSKEGITRKDPRLIEYIEKYGSQKASGRYNNLVVKNIPDGTAYRICEYDGSEYIEYRDEIEWETAEG